MSTSILSRKKNSSIMKHVVDPKQRTQLFRKSLMDAERIAKMTKKSIQKTLKGKKNIEEGKGAPLLTDEIMDAISEDYSKNKLNEFREMSAKEIGAIEACSTEQDINSAYSHEIPRVPIATQQSHSGRCWMFAALNMMRRYMIDQYNLPAHFELSESYLFFWDKIERSYTQLYHLVKLRNRPYDDCEYRNVMLHSGPSEDGGLWSFVVNLINKYGIVPKTVYGETVNSSYSDEMNSLLSDRILVFNEWIRENKSKTDKELYEVVIKRMMPDIYQLVANCMGEPPKEFTWEYNEASNENFESTRQKGTYHKVENLTPLDFYDQFIVPHCDVNEYVTIVNDPTKEYGVSYSVPYNSNMVGEDVNVMFNTDIDTFRETCARSVMDHSSVWFGCAVERNFNQYNSHLTMKGFRQNEFYGQTFDLGKEHGIRTCTVVGSHAMLLVGLNTVDDDPEQVDKWKVENSWGEYSLIDPGHLQMEDDWFQRYAFIAVVNNKYLDPETLVNYRETRYDPVILPWNDPFGAVAQ